jgi:neopullulanase
MTFPGAPCIYYGDEVGMTGGSDPASRGGFPWERSDWDKDLLAFFRQAISLRRDHPALCRGRYVHLGADDQQGLYAFAREGEGETLIVVLNRGTDPYELDLAVGELFDTDQRLRDIWGDAEARIKNGRAIGGMVPPRSGVVLTA